MAVPCGTETSKDTATVVMPTENRIHGGCLESLKYIDDITGLNFISLTYWMITNENGGRGQIDKPKCK